MFSNFEEIAVIEFLNLPPFIKQAHCKYKNSILETLKSLNKKEPTDVYTANFILNLYTRCFCKGGVIIQIKNCNFKSTWDFQIIIT